MAFLSSIQRREGRDIRAYVLSSLFLSSCLVGPLVSSCGLPAIIDDQEFWLHTLLLEGLQALLDACKSMLQAGIEIRQTQMFASRLHPCGDINVLTMTDFEALLILHDDWSEVHACEWTGEACRHRICGWSLRRRTDPKKTFLLALKTGQMALAAEGA